MNWKALALVLVALAAVGVVHAGVSEDFEAARAADERGDRDEAIRLYSRVIASRQVPALERAGVFIFRGDQWGGKGGHDRAIADYSEAIRLRSAYAPAYRLRGMAWSRKGDGERAIADFDEAVRLDPKDTWSYYFRGNAWAAKRNSTAPSPITAKRSN